MTIKEAQDANKQKPAQYTGQETETISIKREVKGTKVYQVQIGPNGQPQKTEVSTSRRSRAAAKAVSKNT